MVYLSNIRYLGKSQLLYYFPHIQAVCPLETQKLVLSLVSLLHSGTYNSEEKDINVELESL